MTYYAPDAKKIADAYAKWLAAEPCTVFGTLKFTDGRKIAVRRALKLARVYWNKLDTIYFGAQVRRNNIRIKRAVFLQMGGTADSDNAHFHFLANPPQLHLFPDIASDTWGRLDNWCDGATSWIELAHSPEAVARYASREVLFDAVRKHESYRAELSHTPPNDREAAEQLGEKIARNRLLQRI